jgi:hypothetical protein
MMPKRSAAYEAAYAECLGQDKRKTKFCRRVARDADKLAKLELKGLKGGLRALPAGSINVLGSATTKAHTRDVIDEAKSSAHTFVENLWRYGPDDKWSQLRKELWLETAKRAARIEEARVVRESASGWSHGDIESPALDGKNLNLFRRTWREEADRLIKKVAQKAGAK